MLYIRKYSRLDDCLEGTPVKIIALHLMCAQLIRFFTVRCICSCLIVRNSTFEQVKCSSGDNFVLIGYEIIKRNAERISKVCNGSCVTFHSGPRKCTQNFYFCCQFGINGSLLFYSPAFLIVNIASKIINNVLFRNFSVFPR